MPEQLNKAIAELGRARVAKNRAWAEAKGNWNDKAYQLALAAYDLAVREHHRLCKDPFCMDRLPGEK